MLNRIRGRLTYANVTATIALFLALGLGTAWAIENNSVKSKHIKDGEVKPQDLADSSQAYAYVTADGNLVGSRGVEDVDQFKEFGIYCFELSFDATVAVASADSLGIFTPTDANAKTAVPAEPAFCEGNETDASVRIIQSGNSNPHPFYVIFE